MILILDRDDLRPESRDVPLHELGLGALHPMHREAARMADAIILADDQYAVLMRSRPGCGAMGDYIPLDQVHRLVAHHLRTHEPRPLHPSIIEYLSHGPAISTGQVAELLASIQRDMDERPAPPSAELLITTGDLAAILREGRSELLMLPGAGPSVEYVGPPRVCLICSHSLAEYAPDLYLCGAGTDQARGQVADMLSDRPATLELVRSILRVIDVPLLAAPELLAELQGGADAAGRDDQ
jgi:hypothetical protein